MKVLILSNSTLPRIGGMEIATHNLAEGLVECGQSVAIMTSTPQTCAYKKNYDIINYAQPRGFTRLKLEGYFAALKLIQVNSVLKPDIIHANLFYPSGYGAILAKKILKKPVVITSHGGDILSVPKINYGYRLDKNLASKIIKAVNHADGVIAISQKIYQEYVKLQNNEIPIEYIPNGINYSYISTIIEKNTKSYEQPRILLVGRNHPVKGYRELLSHLPRLLRKYNNLKVFIIGDNVTKLRDLIPDEFVNQVLLFESVSPIGIEIEGMNSEKLIELYKEATIFAMPSYSEGLPVSMIEAMSFGLPIVATRAAGRDLVEQNVNGLLVETGNFKAFVDTLEELLLDTDLQKRFVKASQAKGCEFNRKTIAQKHISFYERLIKG